jgi:hypothetical protein
VYSAEFFRKKIPLTTIGWGAITLRIRYKLPVSSGHAIGLEAMTLESVTDHRSNLGLGAITLASVTCYLFLQVISRFGGHDP